MNATNKVLSIIAFYLSEYDMRAVNALGYKTRTETINTISNLIGNGNNYLKLRRDEFDALPDSASTRKGWRNRPPLKEVVDMAAHLRQFSFEELTGIVKSFIGNNDDMSHIAQINSSVIALDQFGENELEQILNFADPTAKIVIKAKNGNQRIYNRTIITQLKKLYRGCCQICGSNPAAEFETDICEAHHIVFFSVSQNNDSNNIIILCPNHHRLIHKLSPSFDSEKLSFTVGNTEIMTVKLDFHLKRT